MELLRRSVVLENMWRLILGLHPKEDALQETSGSFHNAWAGLLSRTSSIFLLPISGMVERLCEHPTVRRQPLVDLSLNTALADHRISSHVLNLQREGTQTARLVFPQVLCRGGVKGVGNMTEWWSEQQVASDGRRWSSISGKYQGGC